MSHIHTDSLPGNPILMQCMPFGLLVFDPCILPMFFVAGANGPQEMKLGAGMFQAKWGFMCQEFGIQVLLTLSGKHMHVAGIN